MATREDRKARSTQRLVNYYPHWADIRQDEQSAGFQMFNAIGVTFDDLLKEVQAAQASLHLATTPINKLDLGIKAKLPDNFTFQRRDEDPSVEDYFPPVVSGEIDGVFYNVTLAENNEITNYISEPPTRVSTDLSYENFEFLVASGFFTASPLSILLTSGEMLVPSELYVTVRSGEPYIYLDDSNNLHRGLIQIDGNCRYGYEVVDELACIYGEKQVTIHEFDSVSGIFSYGVYNPSNAYIQVQSMDFNSPPYSSAYYLDYDRDIDEDIPSFWTVGSGISAGQSTLDFTVYIHPDLDLRVAGYVDTYAAYNQELKDSDGYTVDAIDLAVQPYSDHIWVVSHTTLYCYSAELPYINLKSLTGRTAERACRIETDYDFVLSGDTITLEFIWRNPAKGLKRHRVSAIHEDGTKYVLDGNSLIAFSSADEYWQYGEPLNRHLRHAADLTLSKAGLYTFTLEATLGDDSVEIDKRVIVSSPMLFPLAEFSFADLGITTLVTGIHIDRDNNIWVRDDDGTIYRILRHYDKMLIDYTNKEIFCKEEYDRLHVDRESYTVTA